MIKKIDAKKTVAATAPKELSKEVLVAVTGGYRRPTIQ